MLGISSLGKIMHVVPAVNVYNLINTYLGVYLSRVFFHSRWW